METDVLWSPTRICPGPGALCSLYKLFSSLIQSDAYLFADDSKIFRTITKDSDTARLQADSMSMWSNTWLLRLNPEKWKQLHLRKRCTSVVSYRIGDLMVR